MNLCFLTIQAMTPFYRGIAARLEAYGHEVSWISPSERWSNWLLRDGVPQQAILNMARYSKEWTGGTHDRTGLVGFEDRADKSVRDLILMDRLLAERDPAVALDYAASSARHAGAFLASRRVEVVFAEPSYLLAYIVAGLCAGMGIANHSFDSVRFPDGRFAMFRGMYQAEIASPREATPEDGDQAQAFHEQFLRNQERPISFYSYLRPPTLSPVLVRKVVRNARRVLEDPNDESGFPVRRMIRDQIQKTWNHRAVTRWDGLMRPAPDPERPFVLYGLHKQPEIGIDVLASYLSNQEELIRAIARSVPISHDLYIKPHANDQGGRSRTFFERLVRVAGVRVLDPMSDTHALIRSADLVMSVTGTMAYEAGLYGRRAITFGRMFFAPLLVASGIDPYAIRLADMRDFLAAPHPADDASASSPVEFLASVFASSYPGVVGDPLVDSRCMETANLDLVATGFNRFLGPVG